MKCPNCQAGAPDGAAECPSCGVIFAKLRRRRDRDEADVKARVALLDAPAPSRSLDPRKYRDIAIAIVLVWLAGMAAVVHFSTRRRLRAGITSSDEDRPPTVIVRDPVTGDLKELPILDGGARARGLQ